MTLILDFCHIDKMLRTLGLLSITLTSVAAHPCETEHFASCPEHGPDTLGKCLAGLPSLSDECKKWTTIHDACLDVLKSECKTRCGGEPCHYRDDAVACLTEWTAADKITKECAAVLPERKVVEEEVESDAKKKRRQKRKNRRKKGGEEVKKYHANAKKEKKEEAKKKAKKDKKKKKKKKKKNTDL